MTAYYNEIDPKAAATLRMLIDCGLIAPGDVDERSIEDVLPSELAGYQQCHFFAGFGIWSYALRQAGWPDERKVWTGSCPCQPFSAAGKSNGFADERHLWPAFFHLIQFGKRPHIPLYGEQVASPDALTWLDLVSTDMEAEGHTVRTFDLCAAGFGAPIIRQRLFWLASSISERRERGTDTEKSSSEISSERSQGLSDIECIGDVSGMAVSGSERRQQDTRSSSGDEIEDGGEGWDTQQPNGDHFSPSDVKVSGHRESGPTNGFWKAADWLRCRDDKWRPVEPGTFPLANGYPERMGILRGAGNAINAEVAKAFIQVTM